MRHAEWRRWSVMYPYMLLLGLTTSIFLPMLLKMMRQYDFFMHALLARNMVESQVITTPHFLLQLLIIAFHQTLIPSSIKLSTAIVVLCAYLFLAVVLFRAFKSDIPSLAAILLTLATIIVAPITLPAFFDGHLYYGYIAISVFHNPTAVLTKPLAVLLIFGTSGILANQDRSLPVKQIVSVGLLTFFCAFAKPSFVICFLPALVVYLAGYSVAGRSFNLRALALGFAVPALLILALQYYFTYSPSQTQGMYLGTSSIVLDPFTVMAYRSSWLPLKFLLSVLFPLMVTLCYYRRAKQDPAVALAWLTFFCGAFYTYFLAESGPRLLHRNFFWSGQISLFVLFVVTVQFLLRQFPTGQNSNFLRHNKKLVACGAVFCLHVMSGIVYYLAEYTAPSQHW